MIKIGCLLALVILTGCTSSDSNGSDLKRLSNSSPNNGLTKSTDPTIAPGVVSKEQLLGAWTDGMTENASFEIGRDSIFYIDQLEAFPYSLKDDSVTIDYSDITFKGKVQFNNDTLSLTDSDFGTSKYTRFNN